MERVIFGLHKNNFALETEVEAGYEKTDTPAEKDAEPLAENAIAALEAHDRDAATYRLPGVYPKVAALRIVIVVATVAIACAWEERLLDLLDFTGASSIAVSCMIMPIVFYLKQFGNRIGVVEKIWAYFAVIVSLVLGAYVTYISADPLFNPPSGPAPKPTWDNIKFPFCPADSSYARITFTNVSYHQNFTSLAI
ncbi:hypothetical protein H310_15347 [Aphanomyces invadans]|nr:hypothetical protein H310_15347 [Aphanomyces invadans]ETV89816.1 hypothetical protein H310_15347 [Aphanomyces invadans]|eukprot:XP_008881552.1 hypothetical protein H310_15347 [Aphanomyces invadans]